VGEPAPTAPTVALLSPAAAGNCDNGAHRVGLTFITADGETEIGPLSDIVTIADKAVNGQIACTNVALGGTLVTSRKAYLVPVAGGAAKYAATISNNTASTLTINVADASLGAEAPTVNTTVDPEILRWIDSAESRGQRVSRRAFRTQTWDLVRDAFPSCGYLEIPKPPLQTITHLKYRDTAGVLQTWDAANYVVEAPAGDFAQSGTVTLAQGISWPTTYGQAGDVQVRFVAGYGATSAVPKLLKDGCLLWIATRAAQREDLLSGSIIAKVPGTSDEIFKSFRVWPTQSHERAA